MKYSQATDYALHAMLHLAATDPGKTLGVQPLAEKLGVSQTYLSKLMTKLVKAGLIQSAPGAGGGYRLKRSRDDISFLDVIHAIEGTASLLECSLNHGGECVIQQVVLDAERQMEEVLKNKKIADLAHAVRR